MTPRPLLFMPDYSADPVWDLANEAMVRLERLPVSEATRTAVRAWAKRWDALASRAIDESAAPVPAHAWTELERDGQDVWRRLRDELGPDWRLGWASFPDGRRHVQWEPGGAVELCLPGSGSSRRA